MAALMFLGAGAASCLDVDAGAASLPRAPPAALPSQSKMMDSPLNLGKRNADGSDCVFSKEVVGCTGLLAKSLNSPRLVRRLDFHWMCISK